MTEELGSGRTQKRVVANEATPRAANDIVESRAKELGTTEPVPLLCECAAEGCREVVLMSLREYREIRAEPARFFVIPSHVPADAGDRIVESRDDYVVIEKAGQAASIASESLAR